MCGRNLKRQGDESMRVSVEEATPILGVSFALVRRQELRPGRAGANCEGSSAGFLPPFLLGLFSAFSPLSFVWVKSSVGKPGRFFFIFIFRKKQNFKNICRIGKFLKMSACLHPLGDRT